MGAFGVTFGDRRSGNGTTNLYAEAFGCDW